MQLGIHKMYTLQGRKILRNYSEVYNRGSIEITNRIARNVQEH